MSRRALQLLLMVLVLLVVSCGSDQSDRTVATTVTTGATDPAPSDAPVAGGEDVEVYLEEWFGLRSDLDLRFQSYFEELPAEAPQTVEFVRDFWLGLLDLMLAHADDLESIEAAVWSEGTLVFFDYRQGEFEAGAYVVVERSGT